MDWVLVDSHYQTVSAVSEVLDAVINDGAITTARVPFRPYTMAEPVHVSKKFLGNALKVPPRRHSPPTAGDRAWPEGSWPAVRRRPVAPRR